MSRLRVAVIGAGMAGKAHAAGYRSATAVYGPGLPDVRLVSIADAEARGIEAVRQDRATYDLPPGDPRAASLTRAVVFGAPDAVLMDLPQLTEERRRDMVKLAKSKGEDGKIAIRNVRRQGMEALKKIQKDGDAGEDEVQTAEKALDKTTQGYVGQIDEIVQRKENELLEV